MLLLAFDTSTPAVTVALHDGVQVVAEATEIGVNRQGELLMPCIQTVLAFAGVEPRDLTHVVSGTGPGPFTGLRVGLVTARALGDALAIQVHGVCSLDALALLHKGSSIVAMSDARRREAYFACYSREGARTRGPSVAKPADVHPPEGAILVGAGAVLYREQFPDHTVVETDLYPEASGLAALAVAQIADGTTGPAEPLYLRRPDAVPPAPRKQVSPA